MSKTKLKVVGAHLENIRTIKEMMISTYNGNGIIPQLSRDIFMDRDIIQRVAINRLEELRQGKIGFLKVPLPTHDEIALFIVENTITVTLDNEAIEILPGVYLGNGNCRRTWYENPKNAEYVPTTDMVAMVYNVTSGEEYRALYDSYDSIDSVDRANMKIQGAIGFLKLNVNSRVARSGGFMSALNLAHGGKESPLEKVAEFQDEIELLDHCGIFNADKDLKFQSLYGALLIAAKFWGEPPTSRDRLISGLQKIASSSAIDLDTGGEKWDGLTAMLFQIFHPEINKWIPVDMLRKTNYASIEPQMDFFLYCMELYMNSKKLPKRKGFNADQWEGSYKAIKETM
jgi:hypothetical protein